MVIFWVSFVSTLRVSLIVVHPEPPWLLFAVTN